MIKTQPLRISIVTPAFNSVETIADTIESVASQHYPNVEHIVMDGGSRDGTVEIISERAAKLAFWISQADGGQYDAIAKGLNRTSGDICGWLNADDMLMPHALHVIDKIFSTFPDVAWISSLQPGSWDTDGFLAGFDRTPGFSRAAFLDGLFLPGTRRLGYWIQQESTFWRRSLWNPDAEEALRSCSLAGDFALWAHFFRSSELVGVDYPLAGFRSRAGQRSQDIEAYMVEATSVLRKACVGREQRARKSTPLLYHAARGALTASPSLDGYMRGRFGYGGIRVRNADLRQGGGRWVLEHYPFWP